jgi:hypothetical protein
MCKSEAFRSIISSSRTRRFTPEGLLDEVGVDAAEVIREGRL